MGAKDAACLSFEIGQTVWLADTQSKAVVLNFYVRWKVKRLFVRTENNTLRHLNARDALPTTDSNVLRNAEASAGCLGVRKEVRRGAKSK